MKRKDNRRTNSENSDDTCCSQDTTITNVSYNSNGDTTGIIKTITEQDEEIVQEKVTFDGNTDVTFVVPKVVNIDEKTDNAYVSLHQENVEDNKAATRSNQKLNTLDSKICKYCSSCCSVETEPLLAEDSIQSTNSIQSLKTSSKESKNDPNPISDAKTFPRDILCSACKNTLCACGQNVRNKRNNADNNVKSITENYIGLKASFRKMLRILVALAVLDLIMIICVVTVVPTVAISRPPGPSPAPPDDDPHGYNICFDCADLEKDRAFSTETLRGLIRRGGHCCFKSITSVYFSIKQMFQNQVDDGIKSLNNTMAYLQTLLVNGTMVKRNFTTDYIIGRLLMLNPLTEKIATHLVSTEGPPEQETTVSGVFYKVRWNKESDKTVLRGKTAVRNGLNLQVHREGYYFVYTRLQFKTKPGNQEVAITYSINRQRGSTSTYIHEVKESCRATGSSLEHGGVVEMVVHLLRFDEIFVSVSKSDIDYLATEAGAHMLGLFEL